MDMDPVIKINILEVKSPSLFTARVVLPWEQEAYKNAYHHWQNDMHLNEERDVINHTIHLNEVYATKDSKSGCWHRARVDGVQQTVKGQLASCYFVDSGKQLKIMVDRLYKLPEKYQDHQVPFQVRTLKLWGLQPVSLMIETTETGICVPQRPSKKWDSSAEVYFRSLTEGFPEASVKVKHQDSNGKLQVILFLSKNGKTLNVNEDLIKKEYACALDLDAGSDSDNSVSRQQYHEKEMCENRLSFPPQSDSTNNNKKAFVCRQSHTPSPEPPLSEEAMKHVMAKVKNAYANLRQTSRNNSFNGASGDCRESCNALWTASAAKGFSQSQGFTGGMKSMSTIETKPGLLVDIGSPAVSARDTNPSFVDSESSSFSELQSILMTASKKKVQTTETSSYLPNFDNSAEAVAGVKKPVPVSAKKVASFGQSLPQAENFSGQSPSSLINSTTATGVYPLHNTSSRSGLGRGWSQGRGRGRGCSFPPLHIKDLLKVSHSADTKGGLSTVTQQPAHKMDVLDIKTSSSTDPSWMWSKSLRQQSDSALPEGIVKPSELCSENITESYLNKQQGQCEKLISACANSGFDSSKSVHPGEMQWSSCSSTDRLEDKSTSIPSSVVGPYDARGMDVNMLEQSSDLEPRQIQKGVIRSQSSPKRGMTPDKHGCSTPDCGEMVLDSRTKERSFIELLRQGNRNSGVYEEQVKVPLVWRPDRPMPTPLLGTMVWGIHPPSPVYDASDITFNDVIKQYMLAEGFKTPRAIQAHIWPAILRGRHVIGISPAKSGKKTAYLPPLLSMLLMFSQYQKLPKGMGPKAIVLVPSSKRADCILSYVRCMIKDKTTLKALVIYGCEDHHVMPLLRGCDLLIATPHCLLRMLESRYTQLDRLCHLVLDEADTLIEEFTPQVHEVMKQYAAILKKYKGLLAPRQMMLFGTRWTAGVGAYQEKYMPDPVLVFASRLEASVYGKVKQIVHLCFHERHLSTLRNLLEPLMVNPVHFRIIITVFNSHYMARIEELLNSLSVYAQVIGDSAPFLEIDDKVDEWQNQFGSSVLVVTDKNVSELRVTCAHIVIHFDMPDSRTKFGNRLALMLDYFHDSCQDQQKKKDIQPESHLLVTNKMLDNIESLHAFLQRSSATIPPAMEHLLEGMHVAKNEDENRTFCQKLRQFGQCRDELSCEHRHIVLPCDIVSDNSEQSWPPASGTIKIRIVRVIDASHYYVLLLEHQVPGQKSRNLQSAHTSLLMDLAMHLSNPENQEPFDLKQGLGCLAAVPDKAGNFQVFKRVRILSYIQSTLTSGPQAEVFYVDEGLAGTVSTDQLLKLPPKLQQVPPLAVEVFICRVKPVDGDTEWTRSATEYAKSELKGKDLFGNIVLRMQNTIWIDPLAQQTRLKSAKANIITRIIRPDLLDRGMAVDNPDHVKNLYKLCEGKIPIERKLYEKYFNLPVLKRIETEVLKRHQDLHEVCISTVDDPQHFFVQKTGKTQKLLEEMQKKLNKYVDKIMADKAESAAADMAAAVRRSSSMESIPAARQQAEGGAPAAGKDVVQPNGDAESNAGAKEHASQGISAGETSDIGLETGTVCVAKFADDGSWYRSRVLDKVEDGWKVFFIDYGEQNVVAASDIYHIPDKFCQLPAQALECALAGIKPIGEEWSAESGDTMSDLAYTISGDKKKLLAKVLEEQKAQFAGATKYTIELYDTYSFGRELCFSKELVWTHHAASDEEMNLFPKVKFDRRKMYRDLDAKISGFCDVLYWMEKEEEAKEFSQQISDCVLTYMEMSGCIKPEHTCLQNMVKLIGYLRFPDVHLTILSAVTKCVKINPEVCAVFVGVELVMRLAYCMEQVRCPAVQLQAITKAVELAKISGFTECMDQREIISVVVDMLKCSDCSPEMLEHACSFLSYMLQHGEQCAVEAEIWELGMAVIGIMPVISDPEIQESLLALLAAMSVWKNLHSSLLREKSVEQILRVMREAPSQRCVLYCAQICQSLCQGEASRRNKRTLLEGGLVLIINDLLEGGMQSPAKELCEELKASLAVSVPQHEVLSGTQMTSQLVQSDSQTIKLPPVKWSQNSFRIVLTVTVQGAKESDFTITRNEIHFRCLSGDTMYGFDYTLYGDLVLEKCQIVVHYGEVNLSLCKEEKGKWSRLLKEKRKPTSLAIDFDKLVDSSESELEEPENVTMLSKKKSLPRPPKNSDPPEYDFSYDENSSSDTSDEIGSCSEDEERFAGRCDYIDPVAVMDDLISSNVGQTA